MRIPAIASFVIGVCLLAPMTVFATPENFSSPAVTKEKIFVSVEKAQDWLVNFQKENGLYHYIFQPWGTENYEPIEDPTPVRVAPGAQAEPDPQEIRKPYPDDDNIVRQILSYWALIKSTDFRKTDVIMNSIASFEKGLEPHIVIEDSPHGKALFIQYREGMKVNSTALYLASLLSKKDRGLPLSAEQENHIEYAVNGLKVFAAPSEGFYYYHNTDRLNFISSYGSGEAQLALAQYINHTQDEDLYQWTHKKFDEYFNVYYKRSFDNPSSYVDKERIGYHTWALYYLREIDKYKPVDYEKYVKPLVQYAFDFKAQNEFCRNAPCIYSMAMWDSSSVEGMSAAYSLMVKYEKDQVFLKQVKDYLDSAVEYLLGLQIHSVAQYEKQTGLKFTNNEKHLIGGFCDMPHCNYMRNEVTMHVAAALMEYYNLFYQR